MERQINQLTAPAEQSTNQNSSASMHDIPLSDKEYQDIRYFIYKSIGIDLGEHKQTLVISRLRKRLRHYGISSYGDYYYLAQSTQLPGEQQLMLDLLTTNETYFFREKEHFNFLVDNIFPKYNTSQLFRVWSAASSSGEEAYSIAMELAEHFKTRQWEIIGSDISLRILDKARRGHYNLERNDGISDNYLKKYCLKGTGPYRGTFLISPKLRHRVLFRQINLIEPFTDLGEFDVVFLRNVMIYFDDSTKNHIIRRISSILKPGGYLFIGHAESLSGMKLDLRYIAPTIYRKDI